MLFLSPVLADMVSLVVALQVLLGRDQTSNDFQWGYLKVAEQAQGLSAERFGIEALLQAVQSRRSGPASEEVRVVL
jgi:hypothetical protein